MGAGSLPVSFGVVSLLTGFGVGLGSSFSTLFGPVRVRLFAVISFFDYRWLVGTLDGGRVITTKQIANSGDQHTTTEQSQYHQSANYRERRNLNVRTAAVRAPAR
jgi:hypothetical protein